MSYPTEKSGQQKSSPLGSLQTEAASSSMPLSYAFFSYQVKGVFPRSAAFERTTSKNPNSPSSSTSPAKNWISL